MLKVYETAPGEIVVTNGHNRVVINDDALVASELPVLAGAFTDAATLIHTTTRPMQVGEVYDATEIRPENLMVVINPTTGYTYQCIKHKHDNYWLAVGETETLDALPPGQYKILHLGR